MAIHNPICYFLLKLVCEMPAHGSFSRGFAILGTRCQRQFRTRLAILVRTDLDFTRPACPGYDQFNEAIAVSKCGLYDGIVS